MTLIGILGYAQVGKDTTSKLLAIHLSTLLVTKNGYRANICLQKHLATKLKLIVGELVNVSPEFALSEEFKLTYFPEFGFTGRELLQKVGLAMRNSIGEDVWIKALESELNPDVPVYTIPDIRFLNEAEWIKSKGGIIIKKLPPLGYIPLEHESEAYIDSIPYDYKVPYFEELEDLNVYVSHLAYSIF